MVYGKIYVVYKPTCNWGAQLELWEFTNFCQFRGLDIIPSVIKVYMVYVKAYVNRNIRSFKMST